MTSTIHPTTSSTTQGPADAALKEKHRRLWASGDYPAVATEVIAELGPVLVKAAGIAAGDRVLDVAAGSGNAAIPAALAGASVVASDLTPELFEAGRRDAAAAGAELVWEQADAEALPYDDASFDTVVSCVGVMFAPHHQVAADELVRVLRPGGRLGLLSWTPEGFIGQMFKVMKPYAPPPPPGAQPPPLWGDVDHVAALLGSRVEDVVAEKRRLRVDRFAGPEEFRDFFKRTYGPTIATFAFIGDDPALVARLDEELVALARDAVVPGDGFVLEWEYLLLTARRAR